jgi:uncharacterized repeat protein (TIGR03803 family)
VREDGEQGFVRIIFTRNEPMASMSRRACSIALSLLAILAGCSASGGTTLMPVSERGFAARPNAFSDYRLLHAFGKKGYDNNDPAGPNGDLIEVGGVLYGTTLAGGDYREGTVFAMTTTGHVSSICSLPSPGPNEPHGGLAALGGALYGTSYRGGKLNRGAVFTVDPNGCTVKVVHNFSGRDGTHPDAALLAVNGTLYGTTQSGGLSKKWCPARCGTVFSFDPATKSQRVVYAFGSSSTDGSAPEGGLIDIKGTL